MLEFLNLFYYNPFDKNSSLIRNSKKFFFISLCKDKDFILICKYFLKIILKIIKFREYLHISKILLFAHILFIIKNFYQISTH